MDSRPRVDMSGFRDRVFIGLKQRNLGSSFNVASEIVRYLQKVVAYGKYKSVGQLLDLMMSEGKILFRADNTEYLILNMTMRICKVIREERARQLRGEGVIGDFNIIYSGNMTPSPSLLPLALSDYLDRYRESSNKSDDNLDMKEFKESCVECINELLVEIENSRDEMTATATEIINDKDAVVTFGDSETLEEFFKAAAKKRKFQLLVLQNPPLNEGSNLADKLKKKIKQLEIVPHDTSLISLMDRATKVILTAKSIFADGGLLASTGISSLCQAAMENSIPIFVCASFYKITPILPLPEDFEEINRYISPRFFPEKFEDDSSAPLPMPKPIFEYVPPEFVDFFIINSAKVRPSKVVWYIGEAFHPKDVSRY